MQAIKLDYYEEVSTNREIEPSKLIIARGEEVKESNEPASYASVTERLLSKYNGNQDKVNFIMDVDICSVIAEEKADFSILIDGFVELENGVVYEYSGLKVELRKKANFYASNKYKGYGITAKEFEQEFLMEVWRLMNVEQTEGKGMFTFYERVMNAIPRRALDYVREMTGGDKEDPRNKQIRREFDALPLHTVNETEIQEGNPLTPIRSNETEQIEAKVIVEQMLQESSLKPMERKLLYLLFENPDASNLQLSKELGVSDHTVKSMRSKVATKLHGFDPFK
jgi:hypothetical protein